LRQVICVSLRGVLVAQQSRAHPVMGRRPTHGASCACNSGRAARNARITRNGKISCRPEEYAQGASRVSLLVVDFADRYAQAVMQVRTCFMPAYSKTQLILVRHRYPIASVLKSLRRCWMPKAHLTTYGLNNPKTSLHVLRSRRTGRSGKHVVRWTREVRGCGGRSCLDYLSIPVHRRCCRILLEKAFRTASVPNEGNELVHKFKKQVV
jgi:hypothetical protein